jgi:VanZ family protein
MARVALRRILFWGPVALYLWFIYHLSAESDPVPAVTSVVWDKALHTTGYAVLGALLAQALSSEGLPARRVWILATLAGALYGVSDEFHQSFTPGRDSDIHDCLADLIGAAVGAGLVEGVRALFHNFRGSGARGKDVGCI